MTKQAPAAAATLATASQSEIIKMVRGLPGLDQMAKVGITSVLAMIKPADFEKLRGVLLETLAALQQTPRGLRVLEGLGIVEFARSVAPCGCPGSVPAIPDDGSASA